MHSILFYKSFHSILYTETYLEQSSYQSLVTEKNKRVWYSSISQKVLNHQKQFVDRVTYNKFKTTK